GRGGGGPGGAPGPRPVAGPGGAPPRGRQAVRRPTDGPTRGRAITPQPPGRTPHKAPQAPLRCPGGEDTPPEASEAPAREARKLRAKVWFIGAGPGAADLLTLRAAAVIAAADVVIWASSLVQAEVLEHARPGAQIVDSAALPLEDVRALYERALAEDLVVARIHSGDPALWGAVQEQRELCDELGL